MARRINHLNVGRLKTPHTVLALFLLLGLAGCLSVPFDYPRESSVAPDPDVSTRLGSAAVAWDERHADKSGVVRLPHGVDALGLRLRTMELAETSIDAQYFILKKDRAGALFVGKMLLAADRGVKVRLLIDDIFSYGIDRQLSLLNSHPNIEVRLFNPLSRQSLKYWSYLLDFSRANRRMHNKSFTVDNSLSIVGGRNIGEEYFELKQDVLFDDYEVMVAGPVVREISNGFDIFWNSPLALPVEALDVKIDPEELDEWRIRMQRLKEEGESGLYAQALQSRVLHNLETGLLQPTLVDASLVADSPEKLQRDIDETKHAELATKLIQQFNEARKEIILVTPYFIPQEGGMEVFESARQRGVRVVIVTNSLASTNHVPVHSGYTRYRKRLLQMGVEIYEIRAENERGISGWGYRPELVTLHSKASAIDRHTVIVGSLNFDPRSIQINSEMALFLQSSALANAFVANLFKDLRQVAYRVELDEDDKLRWVYDYKNTQEVEYKEPLASLGRRTAAALYKLLPIENQL